MRRVVLQDAARAHAVTRAMMTVPVLHLSDLIDVIVVDVAKTEVAEAAAALVGRRLLHKQRAM